MTALWKRKPSLQTVTSSPSVKYSSASFLILNKLFCLCHQPADHDPQGGQHHVCTAARWISGKLLQDGDKEDFSHYNFWHYEQQQHENWPLPARFFFFNYFFPSHGHNSDSKGRNLPSLGQDLSKIICCGPVALLNPFLLFPCQLHPFCVYINVSGIFRV